MCFSASASFAAAGLLSGVGVTAVRTAPRKTELRYAFIPLFFAAHQLVEGFLWLSLRGAIAPACTPWLGNTFALVAFVLWPTYVPLAVLPMETHRWRRQIVWACLALGLLTSVWLGGSFLANGIVPSIVDSGIAYRFDYRPRLFWNVAYGTAVCVPCWASKYAWVRLFGAMLAVTYQVAYRAFTEAHESVWCYFAALLSLMVLAHLWRLPPESSAGRPERIFR